MTQLLCPKCHNVMQHYERNTVFVDQCTSCGGLFLDRGELEHLIKAEAAYYAEPGTPAPPAPAPHRDFAPARDHRYDDRDYDDRYDSRSYSSQRGRPPLSKKDKRKKAAKSFLEDLLDF